MNLNSDKNIFLSKNDFDMHENFFQSNLSGFHALLIVSTVGKP